MWQMAMSKIMELQVSNFSFRSHKEPPVDPIFMVGTKKNEVKIKTCNIRALR